LKKVLVFIVLLTAVKFLSAQEYSFMYDGLERTYRLYVPSTIAHRSAVPLVVNMHGAGSNAFEQEYYSEFDQVADTAGFIVVYPNGLNGLWNVYQGGSPNDVGFISALIDTLSANYNVDQHRIYATGMSMGGFMSYKLACHLSDKIAAIASVAGLLSDPQCAPSRAFPVCQFHGTADSTVLYDFVPITINFWTGLNECTDSTVVNLPDIDTTDQSTVTLTTYKPCNENTEVLLYTINGGGHSWPGASYIIDVTNQDIHANVEIWKFFSRFTLPEGAGIDELTSAGFLSVYPNPVVDKAAIEINHINSRNWNLRLFDISGRLVWERNNISGNKIAFKRENLISGIYIVEVTSGKLLLRQKILIK
jgi:polyhydroxybutyrate depolymerase